MADTLRPGDRVLVNKLVYRVRGIDRGDVVVFSGQGSWDPPSAPPSGPLPAVLRLTRDDVQRDGLCEAGHRAARDRVSCCDARGRVTVNGVPLSEQSYLYPGNRPSAQPFSVTVPPGGSG